MKDQIKEQYNKMVESIDDQLLFSVKRKINCYTCKVCGHITKCKHIDQGVTPFMHSCEKCGNTAISSMFNDLAPTKPPTEEWYRPTLEQVLEMDPDSPAIEHVLGGGLLCRNINKNIVSKPTIPDLTEYRAIKIASEKFGTDITSRFLKVEEEFKEFKMAFVEYLQSGDDTHLKDETSDLYYTITHFASLLKLFQSDLLEMAMDKIKVRETDPEYKRYRNKIDILLEKLKFESCGKKGIIIGQNIDQISDLIREKYNFMASQEIPLLDLETPILSCKVNDSQQFFENKPGTKQFRNSLPKFNNSNNKKKRR